MSPRYVRTEGDRRARKAYRARVGRWRCPGCGQKVSSLKGLGGHLTVGPDCRGACKGIKWEWAGRPEPLAALAPKGGKQ